jgi:hypothetical protein
VAYIDGDVLVRPGWLAAIGSAFDDPDVHLAGGRCIPQYESPCPDWLNAFWVREPDGTAWCGALSLVDPGHTQRDIDPVFIFGANFAIRRRTLFSLGGFHPDGLPWELRRFRGDGETAVARASIRAGLRARYVPEGTVLHRVPAERMTDGYFERRAFLQGISDSFTVTREEDGPRRPATSLVGQIARRMRAFDGLRSDRRRRRDWAERLDKVARAHAAGYAFHQQQYRDDPDVRAWVRRHDYWDAAPPLAKSDA